MKNKAAQELGRLGGKKLTREQHVAAAKKRWENVSPEERSEYARKIATARYAKKKARQNKS